jgi:FtsZ-binding cell division protein ZapB
VAGFEGSNAARNAAQAVQNNEKDAEIADLWNNLTEAKSTKVKLNQKEKKLRDQWCHQQDGLERKLTAREDTIKTISTEKAELQEQQHHLQQKMSTWQDSREAMLQEMQLKQCKLMKKRQK